MQQASEKTMTVGMATGTAPMRVSATRLTTDAALCGCWPALDAYSMNMASWSSRAKVQKQYRSCSATPSQYLLQWSGTLGCESWGDSRRPVQGLPRSCNATLDLHAPAVVW